MSALTELTPIYGPFFGVMGAASAMIFSGNYFYLFATVTSTEMNPVVFDT